LNNRADVGGTAFLSAPVPVTGGFQVLNAAAFSAAQQGQLGTSGRNAFTGPDFYSVDVSLSRSIAVRRLGDQRKLCCGRIFSTFLTTPTLASLIL